MSPSIGIIGGADGPTAIFVTTSGGSAWIAPALVILAIALWLFWRRRRK